MQLQAWFTTVLVSGAGCAALAAAAIVVGFRRRSAELTLLGAAFTVASLGMALHGLAGLHAPDDVGDIGMRIGVPVGIALALPVLCPGTMMGRRLLRHWRGWTVGAMSAGIAMSAVDLMVRGRHVPAGLAIVLGIATALGGAAIARRQWYLYRIGRRPTALVAASAIVVYTATGIAAQWAEPASAWGWIIVGTDAAALAVTVTALMVGLRVGADISDVLAPVIAHEPLTTLEVGLAPEIRAFVAALGDKDSVTRNHVVRTSALAVRVAIRAKLPPGDVRDVALGALLHDIGKLLVPEDILNKIGALTDDEYQAVKQHPAIGAHIVRGVPSLVSVAHLVGQHHERPDGLGYPDGLRGDDLSLASGIVSVCDAWDAMVEDRPYRPGMPPERAATIIADGAGSQWRSDAADLLLREVRVRPRTDAARFERLDRIDHASSTDDCSCAVGVVDPVLVRALNGAR